MSTNKLLLILPLVLGSFLFSACSLLPTKKTTPDSSSSFDTINTTVTPSASTSPVITKTSDIIVALKTKYGQIVLKLYSKETPNTVANFLKKANSGFYNNLKFHRVEPGFVVQGGDPKGDGSGGGSISSELNNLPFKRGSVGLARTPSNKNISNDSQFFICLATDSCSQLTGDYVNFAEVISGMEIVDQIKIGDLIIEATTKTK